MKILNKLTINNLKLNKRRSIVTIIGIILSTSLIVGLFTILYNDTKYIEDEELKIKSTKEYTIVGIINRPSYFIESYTAPGYTVITYSDMSNLSEDDYLKTYITLKKKCVPKHYQVVANILGIDANIFEKYSTGNYYFLDTNIKEEMNKVKYEYEENTTLIEYETLDVFDDSFMRSIYNIAIIIVIIIIITSITCISNSFNISITEKLKSYGMLKSIGATNKQIKKNVYYEAFILSIIGIPIGIICGLVAIYILCIVTKNLFINSGFGITLKFNVSIISILLSILVSSITIFLSSKRSAKRASMVSPITSIKSSKEIKSKNLKVPKIINIFKTGGILAYKSQKRYKSKYRITVISILVSVAVFIGLSYFVDLFKELIYEEYNYEYNMTIYYNGTSYDNYEEVLSLNNIEKYSIQKYSKFLSHDLKYTDKIKELFPNELTNNILVYSISKDEFIRYMDKLHLKYDNMWDKGILINYNSYEEYSNERVNTIKYEYLNNTVSEKIDGCFATKDISYYKDCNNTFDIIVGYATDILPMGDFARIDTEPIIIVSEEYFNKYNSNTGGSLYIYSNDATTLEKDISNISDDYEIDNIDTAYKRNKNLLTLVSIFLYGFITVITLIGLTNIFNTLTTGMFLRKREFASLRSIGMTKHEFNRMIFLESFFYCIKSLIFGIPLGLILSYIIYLSYMDELISFKVPILSIIISIIVVLILINILMFYCLSKIKKDNIIEDIRKENI